LLQVVWLAVDDFVLNIFQPINEFFAQYFMDGLSQDTVSSGMMLCELISLRENFSSFTSDPNFLARQEIDMLISFHSSN
jgi:hypothetical protein